MPAYEYVCQHCGKAFEVRATMAEYSEGLSPVCPNCGSKEPLRVFTSVNVMGGRRGGGETGCCGPAAGGSCCG
jgi:putative FmdB family regulatory protein